MAKKKPQKQQQKQQQLSPEAYIKERARQLPIVECYVGKKWDVLGEKTIVVARQHPQGSYTMGVYLIDTFCKGLLHSEYGFSMSKSDYRAFVERIDVDEELQKADYADAHKWVYGAVAFAKKAGINPDSSFAVTKYILEENTEEIPLIELGFGKDGKHHLRADNNLEASRYLSVMTKVLGDDFTYSVDNDLEDEDEDDEDFYDDDDFDDLFDNFELPVFTEYTYVHPEYPKSLDVANDLLVTLFYDPKKASGLVKVTVDKVLALPHDTLVHDLEQIILFEIGLTCDKIPAARKNGPRISPLIHALFVLGEVGNESSLGVLLEVFRQTKEFTGFHFGELVNEVCAPTVYQLGNNSLPVLLDFMKEPGLDTFVHYLVVPGVTLIGREQPHRREEVIAWFRDLLEFYGRSIKEGNECCDSTLIALVICNVVDLGIKELLPLIKELYDAGSVNLFSCGDYETVADTILGGGRGVEERYIINIFDRYRDLRHLLK